jgi:RNA polymerase sigma-70 factor (ECF subfamily)
MDRGRDPARSPADGIPSAPSRRSDHRRNESAARFRMKAAALPQSCQPTPGRAAASLRLIWTPPTIRPAVSPSGRPEVSRRVTAAAARGRELAARLVAGDESALREVYRATSAAVYGLAMRVLGDETLSEDVTQEVFVRLWEEPGRFDPNRGPLRAYLLAMAHSRAVERVRAEESLRRRHDTASRQPSVVMDDPDRVVLARDVEVAVRKALADLPDAQRVPIEMAYFDGLSYRQVAEVLDEPEGTVKYRIRMGMQKLRAALRTVGVAP